ncbi:1-deoxy-D-xylulose-5-phosphate reductoisomerase [Patescibacteria group bacterium]
MRSVAILGCTGSIGSSAVSVVHANNNLKITGLSVNRSYRELFKLVREFKVKCVHIASPNAYTQAKQHKPPGVKIYRGEEELSEFIAKTRAEVVLSGISGAAGLSATIATLEAKKTLALANKESLVMAGDLVMKLAAKSKVKIIPVDSEHMAIFRLLREADTQGIKNIVLTASGGRFLNKSLTALKKVTPAEAIKHPNWQMGKKITVDSSTMFNKALEVIEAHHLFSLPAEQIEVLIHPESIAHGLVEFADGSFTADLSAPDMRVPIEYALEFPEYPTKNYRQLSLAEVGVLHFHDVEPKRFPALNLGYEVIKKKNGTGAVINAADEEAVKLFLAGKISYLEIIDIVRRVLDNSPIFSENSIADIMAADQWARRQVREIKDIT